MLKYSYKINHGVDKKEIAVNDFYITHDMSYVSGTTGYDNVFGVGDRISIDSEYYPEHMDVTVLSSDTVMRNGYIKYKRKLPISVFPYVDYYESEPRMRMIRYVETDGDTYFQDMSKTDSIDFLIDGSTYSVNTSSSYVYVTDKEYVEDGSVTIDGVKYNVNVLNNSGNTIVMFTDSEGNPFQKPHDWDTDNVTYSHTYVRKFSVSNGNAMTIVPKSIRRFGYRPYILYNGDRCDLKYIYGEDGSISGFGVTVDGEDHVVIATDMSSDSDIQYVNPYDRSMYTDTENEVNCLEIDGRFYELYFDPDEVDTGDIVAIRADEDMPILIGDRVILKSNDNKTRVRLETDGYGNEYASVNGVRYDRISNLCDCVLIDGHEYLLEYEGNSEDVAVGTHASCTLDDGTEFNFKVDRMSNGEKTLARIMNDGSGEKAYTMKSDKENGGVSYGYATEYKVTSYDGLLIDGARYRIFEDYGTDLDGNECNYGSYITINYSPQYSLKVIDVIGNNLYICKLDIDRRNYLTEDYNAMVDDIIDEITSISSFVTYKIPNTFGRSFMLYYEWIPYAMESNGPSSIYSLSDIIGKTSFIIKNSSFSVPISLSRPLNCSLGKSDGITTFHYSDMAEESINQIVDMEKDMYTPVSHNDNGNLEYIDNIEFNFHFRTRDLETWKIINDSSTTFGDDSTENYGTSLSYMFTNWFMTDYYPYNAYSTNSSIDAVMSHSDLLGFLYFTTDDVKAKRKKLEKSFLRISYFDSKNPLTQNLLGTSTVYFDCDSYFDTLYKEHDGYRYGDVAMSLTANRSDIDGHTDNISLIKDTAPTVLREPFSVVNTSEIKISATTGNLSILKDDKPPRLDSRITISGRHGGKNASEGFYPYILKAFSDKKASRTIYMKFEFFHAGVGIKIPMVIATDSAKNAISEWDSDKLSAFKEGYSLDEIYDRLYVPITISYSKDLRKFVYMVSDERGYDKAITVGNGNKLRFNLFELKTKAS